MPLTVTTAFLSLCLIISFQSFSRVANPESGIWLLFFYYVLTKIRYYQGDFQFERDFKKSIRKGTKANQIFILHLSVSVHFLFLVCAYYIESPAIFFRFYLATLVANILLLLMTKHLIEPSAEKLCKVLNIWAIVNAVELVACFSGALLLQVLPDLKLQYPTLGQLNENNVTTAIVIFFFATHVFDVFWNQDFLFPDE